MARAGQSKKPQISKKTAVVEEKVASNISPHCIKLWEVLGECQRSVSCHNRGLQTVMKLLEAVAFEDFMHDFFPALNRMLVVFKREPAIERLIKFVTLVATNQSTQRLDLRDRFLDSLLSHLMKRCDAKDKAIRFRCCQLVAAVLRGMDPESEIAEDLFEEIEKRMLICARDKLPVIRVQAIYALSRLQTQEGDGTVCNEFKRILQTDSHKDCRKAAVSEIALSASTAELVLQRIRDVSPEVRAQAFLVVKDKVPLTSLSAEYRNWLVKQGLQDRDTNVQKACSALVQHWLGACGNDVIELLGLFEIERFPSETEILATHILKELKHETCKPPFMSELSPEKALYWRVLCTTLDKTEEADMYLPDTVQFCELLRDCKDKLVLQHLLHLALFADFQDEAGRKQLESLYRDLLCMKSIDEVLIPDITKGLRKIYARDEVGYIRGLLEIISDIRDPVVEEDAEAAQGRQELEEKFAALVSELEHVKTELQVNRELQKTTEVAKLHKRLIALQQEAALVELELSSSVYQDEKTWSRMLQLVADLLQYATALRGPGVINLLTTTILPALQLGSEEIQNVAIRCLGLYCSLDHLAMKAHIPILVRVLQEDDSLLLLNSALKAVFDLCLIFDPIMEEANAPDEGREEGILPVLAKFLPKPGEELGQAEELKSCAVEGISKLLLFNKAPEQDSRELLQKLLVLFFDARERGHSEKIQQYLTVFFAVYSQSGNLQLHNSHLAEVVVPTLHAIANASDSSPLAKIQLASVSQYLVGMLQTADLKTRNALERKKKGLEVECKAGEEGVSPYLEKVTEGLCFAILYHPDGALSKVACHTLSQIDFSRHSQYSIKTANQMLQEASLGDKPSIKYVTKTLGTLKKLDNKIPLSEEEAERLKESKDATFKAMREAKGAKSKAKKPPTRATRRAQRKKESSSEEDSEEESQETEEEEEEEEEKEDEEEEEVDEGEPEDEEGDAEESEDEVEDNTEEDSEEDDDVESSEEEVRGKRARQTKKHRSSS